MDIQKKIDDLVEEYTVFHGGNIWDFLESNGIHLSSKITTLFWLTLENNQMLNYHLDKLNQYLATHPKTTYEDLCSYESLWFW